MRYVLNPPDRESDLSRRVSHTIALGRQRCGGATNLGEQMPSGMEGPVSHPKVAKCLVFDSQVRRQWDGDILLVCIGNNAGNTVKLREHPNAPPPN